MMCLMWLWCVTMICLGTYNSLPQYALAGKLLTEQRARANNKLNPGHIHLESECYHTTPP